jgi:hypothetical protein
MIRYKTTVSDDLASVFRDHKKVEVCKSTENGVLAVIYVGEYRFPVVSASMQPNIFVDDVDKGAFMKHVAPVLEKMERRFVVHVGSD